MRQEAKITLTLLMPKCCYAVLAVTVKCTPDSSLFFWAPASGKSAPERMSLQRGNLGQRPENIYTVHIPDIFQNQNL